MKPPKRIGKPRSLSAQTNGGSEVSEERIAQLRQDAVPTAALSPDEARDISRAYGSGDGWDGDTTRHTRSGGERGGRLRPFLRRHSRAQNGRTLTRARRRIPGNGAELERSSNVPPCRRRRRMIKTQPMHSQRILAER